MDALSALALQWEWGADEALGDVAIDRTAPPPRAAVLPASAAPSSSRQGIVASGVVAPGVVAFAQARAESAETVPELGKLLANFSQCPLAATATSLAFIDGAPDAGLVFVGDVAGDADDLEGRAFAGPAGRLLDRMLASIGVDRTRCLLANVVPWRPPGNRPPTELEVQMCLPFVRRLLALSRPRIVVTLGPLPTRLLSGEDGPIRKLRGRWREMRLDAADGAAGTARLLPMLHPDYLARTPAAKREAWTDLLTLRRALDES